MEISDINLLKKYFKSGGISQKVEKNELNKFASGDKIYPWTNEPIKLYYEKDLQGKDVLSVTSSGDHILHAALAGAKNITGFDINRFCKYYSALKVAMVKTYGYDEFTQKVFDFDNCFYPCFSSSFKKTLLSILEDASNFLTEDEIKFWLCCSDFLSKFDGKEAHHLFYTIDSSSAFNKDAYFDETLYYQLKQNLSNCNIKYVDSAVDNLNNILKEKYDLIYLSNLLSRIDTTYIKKITDTINSISKLLKKDGIIYDYILGWVDWHELSENENQNSYVDELENLAVCFEELSESGRRIYKYKKQSGDSNGN